MNQAGTILRALGGWDNITALEACIIRIRVEVKDGEAAGEKSLHGAGTLGVVTIDRSIQIVMGPEAEVVVGVIEAPR